MSVEILMPALSPTMEEGTLSKWLKKEGDTVTAGDVIAEIETDKATMEVEAVDEGTIAKIVVPEGTENVKVNAVIAILAEEGEDASAAASKGGDKAETKAEASPGEEDAKAEEPKGEAEGDTKASAGDSGKVPAQPKVDVAADPDIPEGTEMVPTTVREALREREQAPHESRRP